MNALPVGSERLSDERFREQYFDDLARWGFDVAYTAYYAEPPETALKERREGYIAFARDAHDRGLPACVQIQSTVCNRDALSIDEAQYDLRNNPEILGNGNFFASFASEKWKSFLKELTRVFVEEYGYDWVVFEEPMYRVDIPGSKDRFVAVFAQEYPDVDYPTERAETEAYLKVQKLKADILVGFYDELTAHARSVGAKKTGVMPWFFIPTIENTPEGTLNTSCDIGRIAALDAIDFLVVRMQPDNIYYGVMRTGDNMERSPLLYYPEVLAHAAGKPIMAVTNPVDEHTNYPELPLIPLDFFKKALLASMAAAPNGMTRHWYGQRYGEDTAHMDFMAEVNRYVRRLGQPISPIAFVFSYRGGCHSEPFTYETAFRSYWALAKRLMFEEKTPMRTLYADSLAKGLEASPETQVVVLDERFPLSIGQARILRQWWQAAPGRGVVVFGGGVGFSADEESPGAQSIDVAFSEIAQIIGVRQNPGPQIEMPGGTAKLEHVGRGMRTAFLGAEMNVATGRIANVERIFGSRSAVVYSDANTGTPVIIKHSASETVGVFCGLGLSDETSHVAAKIIGYCLDGLRAPSKPVREVGAALLWSETRTGYVTLTNPSDEPAQFTLLHGNCLAWDVVNSKLLPGDDSSTHEMAPHSFRLFRRVGKRAKLYDVPDAVYISSIFDGAGRADVLVFTLGRVSLIAKTAPKDVRVDDRLARYSVTEVGEAFEITVQDLTTGDHVISLRW